MQDTNKINIDGSGNITLQNIHGSTISISKGDDAAAILDKLAQLHEAQLDALQQIMEKQTERFSDLLKVLLKGVVSQKNIVSGSISNEGGSVIIGDNNQITYLIQSKATIPLELTINLPKIPDLTKIIGREQDLKQVRDLLQEKQKVVVVNGLGGIGKTTVAQAYLTQYGGDSRDGGTATSMAFAADSLTAALIPAASTNVWTVDITPTQFVYQLRREGTDRRVRVEFDLTVPVSVPPAPWGATPN